MMPRRAALLCLATALCCGERAQAQAPGAMDLGRVSIQGRRLTADFHVLQDSADIGGAVSVLLGRDGILMVDAGIAPLSAKVEASVRKLSAAPIRYLINTHVHADQTGGNEFFARRGATVVARAAVRQRMQHPRVLADGLPRKPAPALAQPALVYDDSLTLHFNDQDVRLIAVPSAHTDGDTLVHFLGSDVIVAGDVLRPVPYPSINRADGGTLQGMLDALAILIGLAGPTTQIITSHGPPVDRSNVIAQRDLVLAMRERVSGLMAQGKSVDQVVATQPWLGLAAGTVPSHTSAERFVRDVYAEVQIDFNPDRSRP